MLLESSPYYILVFIKKFSVLLLTLPLQAVIIIKGRSKTDLLVILTDIVLLGIIIACACISSRHITLRITKTALIIQKGVLHTRKLHIPTNRRHSICISQNLLQRLLKTHKLTISFSGIKWSIYLSSKSLSLLPLSHFNKREKAFKTKFVDTLIFSAGFHSSLTGVLTLAPFIKNLSSATVEDFLYSANIWEVLGYKNLPPLLATLSTLLLFVWLAGFLFTFLRFSSLCLYKKGDSFEISSGIISKHRYRFHRHSISAVILRQSLLMLLLKRAYVEILLPSGSRRSPVLAGCAVKKSFQKAGVCPHRGAVWSYSCIPLLCLLILSLLAIITDVCSPYKIEPHLGVFLTLWCIVWYLLRVAAFHHSCIEKTCKNLKIRTFSGLSLTEIIIPLRNVQKTKITRNIFQQRKGTCNLKIFIRHKRKRSFSIRHISIKKAAELIEKLCG